MKDKRQMKHTKYVLTRYLYARDEVDASLLTSLLAKEDVCECYFWAYELLYSGFALTDILWRIYYDFYFECNPQLEPYIQRKFVKWEETKDSIIFAFVIRNRFRGRSSSKVFVLRQFMMASETTSAVCNNVGRPYRGRKPKWCENHDKTYHHWLMAISKHDYANIAHHTYAMAKSNPIDALLHELVKYFGNLYDVKEAVSDYWSKRVY